MDNLRRIYVVIFFFLLCVFGASCGAGVDNVFAETKDANELSQPLRLPNALPKWVTEEGIRAGFMSSTSGNLKKIPGYVGLAKSIGLNSVIVYGCSFAEAPNHLKVYKEWFRLCNQADLHIFAFYPWQPPVGNNCRPVVFADGTQGLFPCPLDEQLWQDY